MNDLTRGAIARAEQALAESDALYDAGGLGLADPTAPTVFGHMQQAIAELLRTVRAEVAQ